MEPAYQSYPRPNSASLARSSASTKALVSMSFICIDISVGPIVGTGNTVGVGAGGKVGTGSAAIGHKLSSAGPSVLFIRTKEDNEVVSASSQRKLTNM